ncbi:MAG: CPBP family intramembrane metalloprotease [Thermogemmatispora sp.]|jgi:membrane protease YdiL (CAAX protease family)|uniref:CPBP family intramembrane glutamic endopeptidase n=1 Tax=Thermogemmatispora sp. TaxID=1968838 RepID=UPI0019EB15F0|nr:type II CAAX endopeptidase family protein [Thermogemmatispora sp.]MBE3568288.1 CPBP family intramembrane metalloprotease [Thermogemmatispora sp.]
MSVINKGSPQGILLNPDNRIFALARRARWLPPWYLAIVVATIITLGSGFALQFLFAVPPLVNWVPISALTKSADPRLSALGQLLALVITYATRILLLLAWIKWLEKRPFWTVGLERKGALIKYLRGFVLGMAMYGLAVGILALTGSVSITPGLPQQAGVGALLGIVIVLPGWLVQGASEELVTRGWLLPAMGARYRPWIGVLIATVMFAFFHGPVLLAGGLNVLPLMSLVAVCLFLAAYVLYEQSLWGVLGWHAAWNWTEGNVLASFVSGHSIAGGTLFKLVSVGPVWMTGGIIGPEAGIPVIAVVAVGLLAIILLALRRSRRAVDVEQEGLVTSG